MERHDAKKCLRHLRCQPQLLVELLGFALRPKGAYAPLAVCYIIRDQAQGDAITSVALHDFMRWSRRARFGALKNTSSCGVPNGCCEHPHPYSLSITVIRRDHQASP